MNLFKKEGQRDSELANKYDFTRTKKGIRCYPMSRLQRAFIQRAEVSLK